MRLDALHTKGNMGLTPLYIVSCGDKRGSSSLVGEFIKHLTEDDLSDCLITVKLDVPGAPTILELRFEDHAIKWVDRGGSYKRYNYIQGHLVGTASDLRDKVIGVGEFGRFLEWVDKFIREQ